MKEYFSGEKLYGDNLSLEEIEHWYKEETEAYAELGSKEKVNYEYHYHQLNKFHGFDKIAGEKFENALGFGAAYGNEFEPILSQISNIFIIEPSDQLKSESIGTIKPVYVKPNLDGNLPFEDNKFDLITCFGTLHHIPNVSHVLQEMIRTLKPDGYLLFREPIISMGDWRYPRQGLTKHERGIPTAVFDSIVANNSLEIISKSFCFTMTPFIQRNLGKLLFKKPIYCYKSYIRFDSYLSKLLKHNIHYHATSKMERMAPSSVFYVLKKNS